MAYSKNIRRLAIGLCRQGTSAEEVARFLSLPKSADEGGGSDPRVRRLAELKAVAESVNLPLNDLDWEALIAGAQPSGRAIRNWLKEEEDIEKEVPGYEKKRALRKVKRSSGGPAEVTRGDRAVPEADRPMKAPNLIDLGGYARTPAPAPLTRDLLDLAIRFRNGLLRISGKEYAAWRFPARSLQDDDEEFGLRFRMEREGLKVDLLLEDDEGFPVLMELLREEHPKFKHFERWKKAFANVLFECKAMYRRVRLEAEGQTGLETSPFYQYQVEDVSHEYISQGVEPHRLEFLPLFIYQYALKNYGEPKIAGLHMRIMGGSRRRGAASRIVELLSTSSPRRDLAMGSLEEMTFCRRIAKKLCKGYVEDLRIGGILREQKKVRRQAGSYAKTLSDLVSASLSTSR